MRNSQSISNKQSTVHAAPHQFSGRIGILRSSLPDIQGQIESVENNSVSESERVDAVDRCLASIAGLSNEVKDASSHLPAYDQRSYGDTIKGLSNKLQDVRASFAPKAKFSFKSGSRSATKKTAFTNTPNDTNGLAEEGRSQGQGGLSRLIDPNPLNNLSSLNASSSLNNSSPLSWGAPSNLPIAQNHNMQSTEPLREQQPSPPKDTSISIANRDGAHIVLSLSESSTSSLGTLSSLNRCIVDVSKATSTGQAFPGLTLKNIKKSLVICGHVSGAIHLTDVANSVIVVASRQCRMHESRNCDIYLLATSRPIIEDCSGIRVAPIPEFYMNEADSQVVNQWQNVDDFKWLRNEQSPNWSILDEKSRVDEDAWKNVMSGGSQLGTEDILKAVGIT